MKRKQKSVSDLIENYILTHKKTDKMRRHALINQMNKTELKNRLHLLSEVCDAAFEWIDSVPPNTQLPTVNGLNV